MSTETPSITDVRPHRKRPSGLRTRQAIRLYAGVAALVGVVSGFAWNRLVALPSYTVGDDFRATMSEIGQSQLGAPVVVYSLVGLVSGLVMGIVAWFMFRRLGWIVTLVALCGSVVAGVVARLIGQFMGPRGFADRIAAADAGETVRVDFSGGTWVPLLLWLAAGMLPILVGSVIARPKWITLTGQEAPAEPAR